MNETADSRPEYREDGDGFQWIAEHLPVGLLALSADARIESINSAACRLLGLERADVAGRRLGDVALLAPLAQAAVAGAPLLPPVETEIDVPACGRRVRVRLAALRGTAPGPAGMVVVSERSAPRHPACTCAAGDAAGGRVHTGLQMRQLSSAVEQTADSVMITDANGVITYVNPAFESVTGYARAEVVGLKPNVVRSGLHERAFYRHLWQTILAGEVFRDVFVNRRRDGSIYYEEKSIAPLRDGAGRITQFVSTGRDITDRVKAQERVQHMAYHDPLTDLPNRALFLERLSRSIARAQETGRALAVMFLDLDRFKVINDTLGHDVGDELLQVVAERLLSCIRDSDTVARLGGDECAVLVDGIRGAKDARGIAMKIQSALGRPFQVGGRELFVTSSIGISLYPHDGSDARTLLKHADVAMYCAKRTGKHAIRFYACGMNERADENLRLETDLRYALQREEMAVHYQPQVDTAAGTVVGFEALLRWNHPELGPIPPSEFVPLLEDTGLVHAVGMWVLRAACRQVVQWRAAGFADLSIAVNLSAQQLTIPEIVDDVREVLREFGLDSVPGPIQIEITESVLVAELDATIARLTALSELGVRLSIDDFGTGYASLAYLKRFPIHALKIDRSFICDAAPGSNDEAILRAIIAMARTLELEVVAEGVETREQLAVLRSAGCRLMQGHLFGRPMPAQAACKWLASTTRARDTWRELP